MWKQHDSDTIFISNYAMIIQDSIGKVFDSREIAYYMVANDYFGPRRTNRPHSTPNYGPGKSKFEIYYYRQIYYFPEKWIIYE